MRWTLWVRKTSAPQGGRRSRSVLIPRRWYQVLKKLTLLGDDGDNKARSPGRLRRKLLKPSRRECRNVRLTCGDYACVLFSLAHKAAGAVNARHSLLPLLMEGERMTINSGRSCRGSKGACLTSLRSTVSAHSLIRRSVQQSRVATMVWIASSRSLLAITMES